MAYNPTYPVLEVTEETTDQEIFDAVVRHLAMQGKRARIGGKCANRTPSGLACAFGCLLDDDTAARYEPTLDIRAIAMRQAPGWVVEREWFLRSLQGTHDSSSDGRSIIARLRSVAANRYLSPAIITEFAEELGRWEG